MNVPLYLKLFIVHAKIKKLVYTAKMITQSF